MTLEEIKNNILANVVGGIVLMHDIHVCSVAATEKLLAEAASKSIKVVPLNEVEGYRFDGKSCIVKQEADFINKCMSAGHDGWHFFY